MYIRRKVFSVAYDEMTGEEKLFSTTEIMSEEAYLEEREYTWIDREGNIWKGAKGDKSQGLANVSGEFTEKELKAMDKAKGKYSKTAYKGGAGTDQVYKEVKKIDEKAAKKAAKEANKATKTVWKEAHTKAAKAEAAKKMAPVKKALLEKKALYDRLMEKGAKAERKRLMKVGGLGLAGAGLAAGAAYGGKKLYDKRAALKNDED